jgi:hypothetical protein
LMGRIEEWRRHGRRRIGRRPAREERGAALEVEEGADRWAPHVGEREREERRRGSGGPLWAESVRAREDWARLGRK